MADWGLSRRALLRFGVLVMVAVGLLAPAGALANPPVLSVTGASSAGPTDENLSGTVNAGACQMSTSGWWFFEYGSANDPNASYDPSSQDPRTGFGAGPGLFGSSNGGNFDAGSAADQPASMTVHNLVAGALYYYRLMAGEGTPGGAPGTCNDYTPSGQSASSVQCFIAGQGSTPCPVDMTVSFSVANQRGIAQNLQVEVFRGGSPLTSQTTDAFGNVTLSVEAGDVVHFSRTLLARTSSCVSPEGTWMQGVTYTVPAGAPSQVRITVPNATGPAYQPQLSPAERWVVGQINDMRAAKGLSRLTISTTLTAVADATAHDAALIKGSAGSYPWPPRYCDAVTIDWGWPQLALNTGIAMLDASTTDPHAALAHWTDSSARGQQTFSSRFTAVGIGDGGGAWTMFLSDCSSPPAGVATRCGLTSDKGDSSIQLPTSGGGSPGAAGQPARATEQSLLNSLVLKLRHTSERAWLHTRVKLSFTAAAAGKAVVSIAVLTTQKGHAKPRTTLVAQLTAAVHKGRTTLTLALTKRGRQLLGAARRAKRTLRLQAQVGFTSTARAAKTVSMRP